MNAWRFLVFVVGCVILISCATSKQPYFFSWTNHQIKSQPFAYPDLKEQNNPLINAVITQEIQSSAPIASSLQTEPLIIPRRNSKVPKFLNLTTYQSESTKSIKKKPTSEKLIDDVVDKKEAMRAKFAKRGLVLSALVYAFGFSATLFSGWPAVLLGFLAVASFASGLTFNILGAKSEKKRGLAIAGLVLNGLSVLGVILLLAFYLESCGGITWYS